MDYPSRERKTLDQVVVRLAGDSGDGMQKAGEQFTLTTALAGNDLATFPDFPAEIRAPAGTTFGVSGFQIHFADHDVLTPGDRPDVLVAMNPAALKVNLGDLEPGALVIVNTGAFTKANLRKAGYEANPLEDGSLDPFRVLEIDISKQTLAAVEPFELGSRDALRCKNFWALGLLYWMFDRDLAPTLAWLDEKFAKRPVIRDANKAALKAGHAYGETVELPSGIEPYRVPRAKLPPGEYRNITGNEATAWGLVAAARLSGLEMVLGSYPITPASNVLHYLAKLRHFGVTTFQTEDEIAAVCAAIGASFAGKLGVTTTSGPGVALKTEAIGLAIAVELPLVIVDIQRAGPSTGMPTKTEQSDLLQAMYGRNGDAPVAVVAAATPGDCFHMAIEAARLALRAMTPVFLLTDGYIANGAAPWKIPDIAEIPPIEVKFHQAPEGFHPFLRDPKTLARVWPIPGTPGLAHRIGGLEKDYDSGNISYDPANHHRMTKVRAEKIARLADVIPEQDVATGEDHGKLAVVGWGGTFGAIDAAVRSCRARGAAVSHIHLRYLNPFPKNLGALLSRFDRILVPELNNGQLVKILRSEFLVPARGLDKIAGQPFKVSELEDAILQHLEQDA